MDLEGNESSAYYRSLPKVELHRHLEGSLRLRTMMEVARLHGMAVPTNTGSLGSLVQVQEDEPFTYQNFLAKFTTLRLFYRSPEIIHRVTREAIEDAAADNIRYLELRFTPVALSRAERFPLGDVIDWVCESAREAAEQLGVRVGLLVSVNRHESVELAEQVAWLAAERMERGLVGIDLAGNEAEFPAQPFEGVLREARQAGLKLTVHAGEWGGAGNVREAIEVLHTERIGHGVRILEDQSVVDLARERQTVFEVCLTSNFQTGVTPSLQQHPLMKMVAAGLKVVLATDDPSISQITLADEYRRACEELGMPRQMLQERILVAASAGFLSAAMRGDLVAELTHELKA
jgi:adenosine deaminase